MFQWVDLSLAHLSMVIYQACVHKESSLNGWTRPRRPSYLLPLRKQMRRALEEQSSQCRLEKWGVE